MKTLIILLALFLTSCATIPVAHHDLKRRDVRVIVYTDSIQDVSTLFAGANEILAQAGIKIFPISVIQTKWKNTDRIGMLKELHALSLSGDFRSKDFDIAIGLHEQSWYDYIKPLIWGAAIDDNYRRFIVLKFPSSKWLIAHEVLHGFILDEVHRGGIMTGTSFCLLPEMGCIRSNIINEKDIEEAQRNIDRDFGIEVDVEGDDRIIDVSPLLLLPAL